MASTEPTTAGPDPTGRRVGELATAAGLTVRTLHYYEEIGLLVPSDRTAAGHRLYADHDVARLHRICHLRRLGLPLGEIAQVLGDPAWDLSAVLGTHLENLERRLTAGARLRSRLTQLIGAAGETSGPGGSRSQQTADLVEVLEDMTMLDSNVREQISIIVYDDIEAGAGYLERVFGLGPAEITRDGEGNVVHASLQAGDGVVWLHPESPEFGLASPRTVGASTATMAVMVDDVDAHFEQATAEGAEITYEPVDQPYGYREYSARDHEGGLWSFMKALPGAP